MEQRDVGSAADDTTSGPTVLEAPRRDGVQVWPAFALVGAVTILVGLPLWADGYDFTPVSEGLGWTWRLAPYVLGVAGIRYALSVLKARRFWLPPWRELVASGWSLAACLVTFGLLTSCYAWGKLFTPYFNPRTWDAPLRDLDAAVHFGLDLNRFLLALFDGAPSLERVIDWAYPRLSQVIIASTSWFLAVRDMDRRHRILRGQVMMWLLGLAIYWLVPTLGPLFVFPDLFADIVPRFPLNAALAKALLENYTTVHEIIGGAAKPIRLGFGVAAMPSLHVAVPCYFLFTCMELKSPLRTFYLVMAILTPIGAVIIGWHYALDCYAGALLALVCWLAVRRREPAPAAEAKD